MKRQKDSLKEMLAVLGKMDTITFNGDYLNREDRTGRWVRIYLKSINLI
jgi:hypothetical protein